MKKISERTKIKNIFRKYSRLGLASSRINAFEACDRIRGYSRNMREAYELLAVYDTVRFLKATGNKEALSALYAVYFVSSRPHPKKNEISERVSRYAYENHCDERTVYRRLSYVFKVYEAMLCSNY